jgi:hypothetical protein
VFSLPHKNEHEKKEQIKESSTSLAK